MKLDKIINEKIGENKKEKENFYLIEQEFNTFCEENDLDQDEMYNMMTEASKVGGAATGGLAGLLGTLGIGAATSYGGGTMIGGMWISGAGTIGLLAGAINVIIPAAFVGVLFAFLGAKYLTPLLSKLESNYKKDISKCKENTDEYKKNVCMHEVEVQRAKEQLDLLSKTLKEAEKKSKAVDKSKKLLKERIEKGEKVKEKLNKDLTDLKKANKKPSKNLNF